LFHCRIDIWEVEDYFISKIKEQIDLAERRVIERIEHKVILQGIASDKVGTFEDGYMCFKEQLLYFISSLKSENNIEVGVINNENIPKFIKAFRDK
jgi:hypothetical protein